MKRIIVICLIIITLLSTTSLISCSRRAPELEDVRERFIYLIENSKKVNMIFFGSGLPVYDREGVIATEKGIYYNDELPAYNRVMEMSSYLTVEEMKQLSNEIYSTEYMAALYETAFEGVMTGSTSAYLRFLETSNWIYQNRYATDYKLSDRIYDYSTMEIVKPSNGEYVNITIESYTLEDRTRKTVLLTFVYERGNWYLDSPTY